MVEKNRKLVGWKIWYMDGTILSSRHNIWQKCKQTEIQIVKLFYENPEGKREVNVHHGDNYYILDELLDIPKEIKIGKAMDGEDFWQMFSKATVHDKEFVQEMKY